MREMIIRSCEAKKLLTTENNGEFPTFLKTIGTNFVLKGNAVQWEAAIGWRALAQSTDFRTWWAGLDSNQRRRSHQIYSLARLTTSVPTHRSIITQEQGNELAIAIRPPLTLKLKLNTAARIFTLTLHVSFCFSATTVVPLRGEGICRTLWWKRVFIRRT